MRPVHFGPIAAVMVAWSTAAAFAAEPAPACSAGAGGRQQLRVRVIPGTMDPRVLARGRAEVHAIWNRYHIDVLWEPPRSSDHAPAPDLWVVFLDDGFQAATGDGPLAIARMTFANGLPANRIQVSTSAAAALLANASWPVGTRSLKTAPDRIRSDALGRIVGRSLAHEIGHYVLGSPNHAERGLMRAILDLDTLVSPSTSFLTLSHADAHKLRAARLARCSPPAPA